MTTLGTYLIGMPVVLLFSTLLSMAGLGAAFLFVPFFYWLGVPLEEMDGDHGSERRSEILSAHHCRRAHWACRGLTP